MKNHWDNNAMRSLRTCLPAINHIVADHYLWAKSSLNRRVLRAVLAGVDDEKRRRRALRFRDGVGQSEEGVEEL